MNTNKSINPLIPNRYFCASIKFLVLRNKCYKHLILTFLTHWFLMITNSICHFLYKLNQRKSVKWKMADLYFLHHPRHKWVKQTFCARASPGTVSTSTQTGCFTWRPAPWTLSTPGSCTSSWRTGSTGWPCTAGRSWWWGWPGWWGCSSGFWQGQRW